MFSSAKVDIVTDASGNATVYLTHGLNRKPNGFLVCRHDPGTIDTGADITITAEDNGTPILAKQMLEPARFSTTQAAGKCCGRWCSRNKLQRVHST